MKTALIISDTHGMITEVARLADNHSYDIGFHCGDFTVDEDQYPFAEWTMVQGNNDFGVKAPLEQVVEWSGLRVFITHGHTYDVHNGLLQLRYKAKEVGANLVLFGHTHYPLCTEDEGILYVNPGSFRMPRGYPVPTYAILDVEDTEAGKLLTFRYYNPQDEEVADLQQTFRL